MNPPIVVVPESEAWGEQTRALARRLQADFAEQAPSHGLVLFLGAEGLALHDADAPREQPLRVDFSGGAMGYRQRAGFRRDELLPRAAGIKGSLLPNVLDATAGLGRDAFMLASLGSEVTLCERNPVVHALLEDGLRRAAGQAELAPVIARMHLLDTDAASYLASVQGGGHDVIVLDPMFPERSKSALVKKPMRLFHGLVGADADADRLLELALKSARKRVVVKRPLHAPALGGIEPSFSYKGKAVRFDVYLTRLESSSGIV